MSQIKNGLAAISIALLTGCTFTTTKPKDPVFKDATAVKKELVYLVDAEAINLNGKEVTSNKETKTEVEINIINGRNIPHNDEEKRVLGKSIAYSVKRNLQNPADFQTYIVRFTTENKNGPVTNSSWKSMAFDGSEL
ncbi:MAG TPA: hypothetical protein VGC29_09605 [Flavisolibacter sp.]